jgi:hypothetical protein
MFSSWKGHLAVVRLLLEHGALKQYARQSSSGQAGGTKKKGAQGAYASAARTSGWPAA